MTKKILFSILFAVSFCLPVGAQNSAPVPVLDFNADARSAGMGESTMGESKGMFLYTNPTSFLFEDKKIYGSYSYGLFPSTDGQGRLHFNGVSAGYRMKKQAIMIGFRNWQGLKMARVGEDGIEGKDIKPADMVIDVAYVRELTNHLSAFVRGNYIHSDNEKTASTASASAGLFYRNYIVPCRKEWAYVIGASINNLGGKVKYDKTSFDLPTFVDMGGSLSIPVADGHLINTTFTTRYLMLPTDAKAWSGGFGAEYGLFNLVDLRAGYHFGRHNQYATFGLGGKIANLVNIDAAFHTGGSDAFGSKWRFGIGVMF